MAVFQKSFAKKAEHMDESGGGNRNWAELSDREQNADPSRFEAGSGGNGILGRETGRGVRRGEARGPEPELSGRGP